MQTLFFLRWFSGLYGNHKPQTLKPLRTLSTQVGGRCEVWDPGGRNPSLHRPGALHLLALRCFRPVSLLIRFWELTLLAAGLEQGNVLLLRMLHYSELLKAPE